MSAPWTMARVLLHLVPEHERTSCSDELPMNWYTTEGRRGHPRCMRCALLRTMADRAWPYSAGVTVELNLRYEGKDS